MSYEVAINKAWQELVDLGTPRNSSVKLLADEYAVDLESRRVLSLACNSPAKDFTAILILHYLKQRVRGLPGLTGEWLPFRELSGIEGYYPAFHKRAIEPLIRKYGSNPQSIFTLLERLPAKKTAQADVGIELELFAGVPVLLKLWGADEEFSADANMFFDKSITQIFCIEDIVVLAGIIASTV